LILVDAPMCQCNLHGRNSQRYVKQAAADKDAAAHQAVETAAMQIDVEYGLQETPAGEADQAGGEQPLKITASGR